MPKETATRFPGRLLVLVLIFTLTSSLAPARAAIPTSPGYDFAQAKVVDRVILSVIEDYYDPERIDSQKMFQSIMDALQKAVAELKVAYNEKDKTAEIEVVRNRMTLSTADIDSPWALSGTVHRVFQFIFEHLPPKEYDFPELEYVAANALLATLDPHSNALPPDLFRNLQMDTAGQFGGLGIKITTDRRPPCNGRLTVVEVFDNTPAADAGLQVGDTILRIESESTVNITTAEAADRLRGVPGTKVKIQIKHPNGAVRDYTITRRMVPIASVEWEMLKDKVGYIKLSAFQENSAEELAEALEQLREKDMKGLVLDLRSNPGGLLHVAIAASNLFLSSGTIVTTAGRTEKDRTVENAEAEGTEPMYPMVVLIDPYSASAAEIMAGALRNHGRALLIGETTFGKGSVQMVDQVPDGGAIKLTSAQYLTPGDISIQAVGVPPDLTFTPLVVDKKEIHLAQGGSRFSEADLEAHLVRPNVRTRTDRSPALTAPLLVPPSEAQAERDRFRKCFADEEDDETFKGRYEKEAARRLVSVTARGNADVLLTAAREMIEKENAAAERALQTAFRKLKVDWSAAPSEGPSDEETDREPAVDPKIKVSVKIIDKIQPGKPFRIKATVENRSNETIYRLRAVTKSDNPFLADQEFVFGKLAPKERRNWTHTVTLPDIVEPRVDDMTITFASQAGPIPSPAVLEVRIPKQPSSELVFGWQFQDEDNGDGVFSPGETIAMYIAVKNIGDSPAKDAEVELSAKPGIDIKKGLLDIGNLAPGAVAEGVLHLSVIPRFPLEEAELSLAVREWTENSLGIPVTRSLKERTIRLPVSSAPVSLLDTDKTVTVTAASAPLLEGPGEASRVAAAAAQGTVFQADKQSGNYYRVALNENRRAWIAAEAVKEGGKPSPAFEPAMEIPPAISINSPLVQRRSSASVKIKGTASHPESVRDVIIFVGDKKVLYQPRTGKGPADKLSFSAEVPLKEGENRIVVIARHTDKIMEMKRLFVRRDEK